VGLTGAALPHVDAQFGRTTMHEKFTKRRERIQAERHERRRLFWLKRGQLYVTTIRGRDVFFNPADSNLSEAEKRELEIRWIRWITLGIAAENPFNLTEL
jgi:hypothetical protein